MRSFVVETRRLTDAGLPVLVIAGNHDTPRLRTGGSVFSLLALALPQVTFVAEYEQDEVAYPDLGLMVTAVPHGALTGPNLPMPWPQAGVRNVLTTHGLVPGLIGRRGREAGEEELSESLLDERFDYIALGHYHVWGAQGNNAWYSGSTERTGWGDESATPGYNLVTLAAPGAAPEVERIDIPVRPMVTLKPVSADGRDAVEVAGIVIDRVRALGEPEAMVRVQVQDASRALRREVEAILRRESPAVVWSLQIFSPADVLAPFGQRGDAANVLDLRVLFAQFVEERTGTDFEPAFAAAFRERGGRALDEAIAAAELADTSELDAAPLGEAAS